MPTHDIIDNRNEMLVDHINRILSSAEAARFAVSDDESLVWNSSSPSPVKGEGLVTGLLSMKVN
jgi:hypothetical protein